MNRKVNSLVTLIMMLASVALMVIIYDMVAAGDPDSLQVSLGLPTPTDVINTDFTGSTHELPTITTTTQSTATTTTTAAGSGSRTIVIISGAANIRASASIDAAVLAVAYEDDVLRVIGEEHDISGVLWYKVETGTLTGFVCSTAVAPPEEYYVKKAYLTFDDGPSQNTRAILDILDRYSVKATFFVIYHSGVDDLYREIVNRGHTIALHSYSHDYSTIYSGTDAYFADLTRLERHIDSLTGASPKIMRFPGGSSNTVSKKHKRGIMTELAAMVEARGYIYHDWNVESGDADDVTVPKDIILESVKQNVGTRSNAVILMHDASAKTTTVEALPEIIEYLNAQGYAILPITPSTPPVHHTINN